MNIVKKAFEDYVGITPNSKGFDKTAHVVATQNSIFITEDYSLYKTILSHFRSKIVVSFSEATKQQLKGLKAFGYKTCISTNGQDKKTIVLSKDPEELKKFIKPIIALHIKDNNIKYDKTNPRQKCKALSLDMYGDIDQYSQTRFTCNTVNDVLDAENTISEKINLSKNK